MKTTRNWYSRVLSVIVIGLFLAPTVTFAAWYNPLSWHFWSIFKKAPTSAVVTIEQPAIQATTTDTIATSTATTTPVKIVAPAKPKTTTVATPKTVVQSTPVDITTTQEFINKLADYKGGFNFIDQTIESKFKDQDSLTNLQNTLKNSEFSDKYSSPIKMIDLAIDSIQQSIKSDLTIYNTFRILTADRIDQQHDDDMKWFNAWKATQTKYSDDVENWIKIVNDSITFADQTIKNNIAYQEQVQETERNNQLLQQQLEASQNKRKEIDAETTAYIENLKNSMAKLQHTDSSSIKKQVDLNRRVIYIFTNGVPTSQ